MKDERLLRSLDLIDENYVKEAEPKMKRSGSIKKILGIAACFAVVIALSLYLFIPFRSGMMDLTAYRDSDYFPLIEKIEDFRYEPSPYKNNFEYYSAKIAGFGAKFDNMVDADAPGAAEGGADNLAGSQDPGSGNYVETTDNQVDGVIEADIVKRTDKYIFRLSMDKLKVYSIEGEDSREISVFDIPKFSDELSYSVQDLEMYLSEDASTLTLIKNYTNRQKESAVGIMSVDVSNVNDIKSRATLTIDGSYNSSRMADGKLLLVTEFFFNSSKLDYDKPETYVPSIDRGEGKTPIEFGDIIFPETVGNTRYSVVALIGEGDLSILGASALLNFIDNIYVSENNIFLTRDYTRRTDITENTYVSEAATDIAVLGYSGDSLVKNGVITVSGSVKDQYSLDEHEGYLRIVASTNKNTVTSYDGDRNLSFDTLSPGNKRNVSLYVYDLATNTLVAEVADFAPDGERAESVRFDGDTAYVCTAIVQTFTDPVYFFDLSDYGNITFTDTGVIDGYSTSLINLGDGFLLGIGEEDWRYKKVEVYEERDGSVVSVDKYLFEGVYSTEYKSYLVNREENLFGFGVDYMYNDETDDIKTCYVLLTFNGYELEVISVTEFNESPARMRGLYIDGYLYLTGDYSFRVVPM